MLRIDIPGRDPLALRYLVSDYNGTLACDGKLLPGLSALIQEVGEQLEVHVVTADTVGGVEQALSDLAVSLKIIPRGQQDQAKADYIRGLGAEACVSLGNGRNDRLLLQDAALGIGVVQEEGASVVTLQAADVVCRSAHDAIQLLLNPKRLVATLRT